jgi:hypothetical protein
LRIGEDVEGSCHSVSHVTWPPSRDVGSRLHWNPKQEASHSTMIFDDLVVVDYIATLNKGFS